jgi:WD40 repeat protein
VAQTAIRIGPSEQLPLPTAAARIAISRNGQVIASAEFWGGLVWRRDQPGPPIRLSPHRDTRNIAVSPDGCWVATGSHWYTQVKIWDARTGALAQELPLDIPSDVCFSPDGRWLATTGGGCRLWAVGSWQPGPHVGGLGPVAFSADGKLLAVDTVDGAVRLVDPETGREYARLDDPNRDRAKSLNFSPDGTQLITTTNDSHSIHIWDLKLIRQQFTEMGLD